MSNVIHLTQENFDSVVMSSDVPTIVDFSASWCGPCKALTPIIEKIADESVGKLKVCKIDIDEAPDLASKYSIRGVPTVVVFKEGEIVGTSIGLASKEKILKLVP